MTPSADIHVGLLLINPHLVYWALLGRGVQERAAELSLRLSVVPYQSAETGAAGAEYLVHQQRVDVLIATTRPTEHAMVSIADAAQVPVLVAGDGGEHVVCDVCSDERTGATLIAEHLVQQIGASGTIIELHGGNDVLERVGVLATVLERYPQVQLGGSFNTHWSRAEARQHMHAALADTAVRGVFCHNDDIALGALDALDDAGRAGQIVVTGFDGTPDGLLAVYHHRLPATVYRSQRAVGHRAVELAIDLAQVKQVPRRVRTEVLLITSENVADAMLDIVAFTPPLLRDMVESAAAQQSLHQDLLTAQQALIQALSTPIIPITDRVLVVPLIGAIDTARAQHITATVLGAITRLQAQVIMLDVSGVAVIDTNVAQYLLQTTQAARLLGAEVMLVGITPDVAQTIVHLGVDLAGMRTYSNVQRGLMAVLNNV